MTIREDLLQISPASTSDQITARNDAYGTGLADAVAEEWKARGGRIGRRVVYDPNQPSYNSEAAAIVRGDHQPGRRLRARCRGPHAGLRHPQARQLRPRRVPDLRRLRRRPGAALDRCERHRRERGDQPHREDAARALGKPTLFYKLQSLSMMAFRPQGLFGRREEMVLSD